MDAKSDKESLELLKTQARQLYDKFQNPIWCEPLQRNIFFNSKGFHHLLYNGRGHKRYPKQQRERLSLVSLILPIISNIAEVTYREANSHEPKYYGLTTIIGGNKIRVVLKETESGKIIFWSIILLRKKNNLS